MTFSLEKIKNIKASHFLISFVAGIPFFILVFFLPLFADDFANAYIRGTNQKIDSIVDVLKSSYIAYNAWTGRFTSSTFVYLFSYLGKNVFNFVNVIVLISFFNICIGIVYYKRQFTAVKYSLLLSITIFLTWFGAPVFGETILWFTGSIVYLWSCVICLLFLSFYIRLFQNKPSIENDTLLKSIFMLILGFFAGGTLENLAPVAIYIIIVIYIVLIAKKMKVPKWFYAGGVGIVLGTIFLIIAPGNSVRAEIEGVQKTQPFSVEHLIYFIKFELWPVIEVQSYLYIIFVLLNLVVFLFYKVSPSFLYSEWKKNFLLSLLFFSAACMSNFVMIMSPYFPVRTSFPGAVFLIISIIFLINAFNLRKTRKGYKVALLFTVLITISFSFANVYSKYQNLYIENNARINIVKNNLEKGVTDVIVPELTLSKEVESLDSHVFIRDINTDSTYWTNTLFAKYYGLNSIKAIDAEQVDLLLENNNFSNLPSIFEKKIDLGGILLKSIKTIRFDNRSFLIFEFDSQVEQKDFENKVLYVHVYMSKEELESYLPQEKVQYGFINMDFSPELRKKKNMSFSILEIDNGYKEIPKLILGLYDTVKNGNLGDSIEISNIRF